MNTETTRYLCKECNLLLGYILKSLFVSVPSLLCLASVSLASTALVRAPYLLADSRSESSKSSQCRALFENVVEAKRVGPGFYSRKAANIRSLRLSDGKLQSLQSRFSSTFSSLETAQRNGDSNATQRLGRQASQLVSELNRHCFQ
jgi:hypothetical protein